MSKLEPSEHDEQSAYFDWVYYQPAIRDTTFAISNGAFLAGDKKRRAIQMAKLKAEGFKNGIPDVLVCVARGGYNNLFIEMKVEGGRVSEDQNKTMVALAKSGSMCVVAYSCDEAIEYTKEYLNGNSNGS